MHPALPWLGRTAGKLSAMLIGKEELCGLIPHSGTMCLLEGVLDWNENEVHCLAISHLEPTNPLRNHGQLTSVQLLEYGTQAMAVHGGLLARATGGTALPGYLASLRDVVLEQEFIEGITTPLNIRAQKIATTTDSFMYNFTISTDERLLVSARATVIAQKGAK